MSGLLTCPFDGHHQSRRGQWSMDFLILLLLFKGTFFSFDHPTFIWVAGEKWKRRAAFIPTLFYYYMMMIMMLLGLIYYSNRVNCHLSSSSWIVHVPCYILSITKLMSTSSRCVGFLFKCPPQTSFCASILFTFSLLSTFIPGDMCNKMAHVVECRGGLLHRHFYSMRCTLFIAVFAYYFDEIVK